jgi:hypothetical protein
VSELGDILARSGRDTTAVKGQALVCRPYVLARTRGPLPNVRLIGGLEVPVSRRLAITGTVRSESNDLEDRSHTVTTLGGIRFSLR